MDGVRVFLETSTVHGLSYISTTKKWVRLFWILIVIAGFAGAVFLIHESFDSWSESPIKTTIETLPISKMKFPKVTVCPPKNTFTDLNYDMMLVENLTLTKEMRDEMFKYALEVIEEDSFSMNNWTKIQEKDRFYNWYHGFTKIEPPKYEYFPYESFDALGYDIFTSAISGEVTTQYFGEVFQTKLLERQIYYQVNVYPPENVVLNQDVTLHFKMEKLSLSGLSSDSVETFYMESTDDLDLENQTTAYTNFTPPGAFYRSMSLVRDISSKHAKQIKMDMMPGFKFSWWYTGAAVTPKPIYKNDENNKQFVRYVQDFNLEK